MRQAGIAILITGAALLAACDPVRIDNASGNVSVTLETAPANETEREAIERVLRDDDRAGNGNDTYPQIAAAMHRIDLSHTPADFADAYRTHTRAWDAAAAFSGEIERMTSMTPPEQERVRARNEALSTDISTTFAVVLRIAESHGARVPEGVRRNNRVGSIAGTASNVVGNSAGPATPAPAGSGGGPGGTPATQNNTGPK